MKVRTMRTFKRLLALTPLALIAGMLSGPVCAQTPTGTINGVTPFSWAEYGSAAGGPASPRTQFNFAQSDGATTGATPLVTYPLTVDEQLRAYLLGDYGAILPPSGYNNFLDLEAGSGINGLDSLEVWAGPFYSSSTAANEPITADDDNTLNILSYLVATNDTVTSPYGAFADVGNWTTVDTANNNIPAGTQNYYGDSYRTIPAVNRGVEDNADNGISPNYARWVPYITAPGNYTLYAYFPSEALAPVSGAPEAHVSDARYTIYIKLAGQATPTEYQVDVDQTSGGTWVPLGGPYYLPNTTGQFTVNTGVTPPTVALSGPSETNYQTSDQFVEIRVDDTSGNTLTTATTASATTQNVVVADAIQVRGSSGISMCTPTAINITPPILGSYNGTAPPLTGEAGTVGDYKEIALGYGGGAIAGPNDGTTGGLPISYETNLITGTGTSLQATPIPQWYAGNYGYVPNNPAANLGPGGGDLGSDTLAIDQVVYFTRTESVNTDPNNPLQTTPVGFLYCANGQTGDVIWRFPSTTPTAIGDTDPTLFTETNFQTGITTNTASSYDGETYSGATANNGPAGSTATATWTMPATMPAGRYFVYVWYPSPSATENHIPDAQYSITLGGAAGSIACNPINQQINGGTWQRLLYTTPGTNTVTAEFNLTPGAVGAATSAAVSLGNATGTNTTNNPIVVADAVEFVPVLSMGTSDSSPAVVRNMKVWDTVSKKDVSRSVVIVADNSGKIYCVDAAGDGDGNDVLLDANNIPVNMVSTGAAYEDPGALPGIPAPDTTPAVLPLHPTKYGTTQVYWIWQPNTGEPASASDILTVPATGLNKDSMTSDWTANPNPTNAYGNSNYVAPAVARTGTPSSFFIYAPSITAAQAGATKIFVWDPGNEPNETHIADAEYTVVDNTGTTHLCQPVDQTNGTGAFVELQDTVTGSTTFPFGVNSNANPTGTTTPNTIVLDNTTAKAITGSPTDVVADAVELVFAAGSDANSNLIGPLAFGTNSPLVHVTKDPAGTYTNGGESYDYYDAKIYIGNTNGVLYALDGIGNDDGADPLQRDFSQDSATPSPSVDWWFNVGVTSVDSFGEIIDQPDFITQSIAGTPAYWHNPNSTGTGLDSLAYDQILFTTFSPQGNNEGTLYSVNAQGPVGYYGTSTPPDSTGLTDYRLAAGVADYNLSPVPFFSFPDAYGQLHLPNNSTPIAVPTTDHIQTSLVPAVNGLVPAAHSLGDSAGSPSIFGGVTVPSPNGGGNIVMPYEAYFAANDPTTDGSQPSEGRIWGVNLTTGTVDETATTGFTPYIYPDINPSAASGNNSLDPNYIGLTDVSDITLCFNTINGVINATQFGPFTDGPLTPSPSNLGYYVSSSPAVGIVHTIPSSAGKLPVTLVGGTDNAGNSYSSEYGGNPYDRDVPMLYVGDLNGTLHSINLAGYNDVSRYIQDSPLDGTSIVSRPLLLVNGNGPDISQYFGDNIGGVVFANTQSGAVWESEAFPFIENGLETITGAASDLARNVDFEYAGPGGFSSVSASSFNIDNFQFTTALTAGQQTYTISAGVTPSVDTSEWLYASGDNGFTYGLTPKNTSLGNGGFTGGFDPGEGIAPGETPPTNPVPLNRNFFTSVFATNPLTNSPTVFDPVKGRPPQNLVFDWGQTVYIVIYGLDDPAAGATAAVLPTANYPKALNVTFTIGPAGTATNGAGMSTKIIDLQSPNTAFPIQDTAGIWPPPGYVLTSSLTGTSEQPAVGNYAAVYAYQLGNGANDPQTPGAKVAILNIKEQAQYYTGTPPTQLVTTVIGARSTNGTVIREASSSGTGFTDVAVPGVDQATFSILNPIAVRGAGRSMGAVGGTGLYEWYNMALSSSSTGIEQLGPFSGVPEPTTYPLSSAQFQLEQPALANGNSVPQTAPVGGTETEANGQVSDGQGLPGEETPRDPTIPVILAVSPGMISHGTDGNTATVDPLGSDPPASTAAQTDPSVDVTPPSPSSPGDFGQSELNIGDRSALGTIYQSISRLQITPTTLDWGDNSGSGGALSVVNPLPWETMPTSGQSNSRSADYPDIAQASTSIELLPRGVGDSALYPGTDTVLTNSPGQLANSSVEGTLGDPTTRTIYPNSAMVRVNVPLHQPANLESYDPTKSVGVYQSTGNTRLNAQAANVGQGYVGSYRVYVNSGTGARRASEAYRTVQVWTAVPADTQTSITQQTIDIGNVPAGFGINLSGTSGSPIDNTAWQPFSLSTPGQPSNGLFPFYKPITIVNNGNVNLLNLHLDQYVEDLGVAGGELEPDAFGSFTSSGLSTIPSIDVVLPGENQGRLTGTVLEPLVRSSLDFFHTGFNQFNDYAQNQYLTGTNGYSAPPPGVTAHKARVGDPGGAIVTVPDVPHNDLPNAPGNINLAGQAYGGRPQISIAVPLGTPVGSYSQTITAFEGADQSSNVYQGPIYNGSLYTINGYESVPGVAARGFDDFLDVVPTSAGTASLQSQSSPGTVLKVNVVEAPLTDVLPLTSTTSGGTYPASLAGVDNGTSIFNSNDLQPWAFYDPTSTTFGLLWTSARNASTAAPTTPYSLYGSGLSATTDANGAPLLNSPTNGGVGWWTPAHQLTESSGAFPVQTGVQTQQSYGISTYGSIGNSGSVGGPINALFVTSTVTNGQPAYALNEATVTYFNKQPVLGYGHVLFYSTLPIFSPRGSYYYAGTTSLSATGFQPILPGQTTTSGTFPLVVYYTKIGGRSTLMYWPALSTNNGNSIVGPAAVPVPAGLASATTPNIVARPPVMINGTQTPQVDLVFSGVLGASGSPDIITARYSLTVGNASGTGSVATLVEAPTLPTAAITPTPAAGLPSLPTVTEPLQLLSDNMTWQARDISWYRNLGAFSLQMNTVGSASGILPLIVGSNPNNPAGQSSTATYDRASGQWVFSINWLNLLNVSGVNTTALNAVATWWTGAATASVAPNITAYVNPNSGAIQFSTPMPTTKAIFTDANNSANNITFQSLTASINPMALRNTFLSQTNTAPVAFIDDTPKQNAAPVGQSSALGAVIPETARYWYIYRKQGAGTTNGSASSSVLYYNTRRLTLPLTYPVQLTFTAAQGATAAYYAPTSFDVKDVNGNDVTQFVDLDWARGRVYFPEVYTVGGTMYNSEGQTFIAQYAPQVPASNPNLSSPVTDSAVVTWQDEPMVNSPGQIAAVGEHVLPDNTPSNESDPTAFLDPMAGVGTGANPLNLMINPSSATPAALNGQPYAHKIWVFWTSTRNESTATTSTGSDVYWETLDPRFEVINP